MLGIIPEPQTAIARQWGEIHKLSVQERESWANQLVQDNEKSSTKKAAATAVLLELLSYPVASDVASEALAAWVPAAVGLVQTLVQDVGADVNRSLWVAMPTYTTHPLLFSSVPEDEQATSLQRPILMESGVGKGPGRRGVWCNALALAAWQKPAAFVECLLDLGAWVCPRLCDPEEACSESVLFLRQKHMRSAAQWQHFDASPTRWSGDVTEAYLQPSRGWSSPEQHAAHATSLVRWAEQLVLFGDAIDWQHTQAAAFARVFGLWAQLARMPNSLAFQYAQALTEVNQVLSQKTGERAAPESMQEFWRQLKAAQQLQANLPAAVAINRPRF